MRGVVPIGVSFNVMAACLRRHVEQHDSSSSHWPHGLSASRETIVLVHKAHSEDERETLRHLQANLKRRREEQLKTLTRGKQVDADVPADATWRPTRGTSRAG